MNSLAPGDSSPIDYEKRLRSMVGSWERLHAVIVGFALTSAVRIFADPWPGTGLALLSSMKFHLVIAFVATLVPFFHGAQRHLEIVHLTAPSSKHSGVLFFDYMMLFLEGVLFSLLGMAVGSDEAFVRVLTLLLAVDFAWASSTYYSSEKNPAMGAWVVLDAVSLAFVIVLRWKVPLDWWSVLLAYSAVIRTIVDYSWNWSFYLDLPAPAKPA